ncbi:unnamed protein product [marine sediment metagenome]|uniref:Uncharacterized protein n=1 Tax=marine sediment metagenome TaxID=412755 RepID=X1KUV3_9ZZZZ
MVYITMAYDNGVDFIYSAIIQKGTDNPLADIAVVQRAGVKQDIGLARKLRQYRLAVSDVQSGYN